ncbi:MAG: DUF3450 family protein [Fibrobacterota bacterium]
MLIKNLFITVFVFNFLLYADPNHTGKSEEMRERIESLKNKTSEIKNQIKHVKEKIDTDSSAYNEYVFGHQKLVSSLLTDRDSLRSLLSDLEKKGKELEKNKRSVELSTDKYSSLRSSARVLLAEKCAELSELLRPLEKYNLEREINSLKFLEGELSNTSVDGVEGVERFYQIYRSLENKAGEIETWAAAGPGKAVQEKFSYLRVGFVLLICVAPNGNEIYMWDRKKEKWDIVDDPKIVLAVKNSLDLLEGRAAPELAKLPFDIKLQENEKSSGGIK